MVDPPTFTLGVVFMGNDCEWVVVEGLAHVDVLNNGGGADEHEPIAEIETRGEPNVEIEREAREAVSGESPRSVIDWEDN
jgi:hypothetical protein